MALARFLAFDGTKILRSPGDGHCLLYRVKISSSKQLPQLPSINYEQIKYTIFIETVDNADQYLPFFLTTSRVSLFTGLRSYLINKHYNQPFGDIVPLLLANAFNGNINIFNEAQDDSYEVNTVIPWNNTNVSVDIHRYGDHYNGLIPPAAQSQISKQSGLQSESKQTFHVKDVIRYSSEHLRSLRHQSNTIKRDVRKMLFMVRIWRPSVNRYSGMYSSSHQSSNN